MKGKYIMYVPLALSNRIAKIINNNLTPCPLDGQTSNY